jgi:hypothetical protein
MTSW